MTAPAKPGKHNMTPRSTFTHIGNWTLGETLGRGAYAHVRLATHISGRKAACKILPALHQDPTKAVTWDQTIDAVEAHKEVVLLKALSGIKLPGVVELEGVVERDGWTYMFSTLHHHSAAQEHQPWEHDRLVNFFRRLCLAVHALHQLNISHEDIKRSNVLVDAISCPALIDFGFSHFAAYRQPMRSAGGTLDYSSPEKVRDSSYDGPTTDVWSLGILLTKMLAVPHPFIDIDSDTESMAKDKIIEATPEFHFQPHHLGRGKAASLIVQMLEPDPRQRITMADVLDHPFLMPAVMDPRPFVPPPYKLPSKIRKDIPPAVILDVCFLAYLNKELFMCETFWLIEERIFGPEPCWEKRWATMLYQWKEREEMDWEDIAVPPKRPVPEPSRPNSAVNGRVGLTAKRTVLREINLDSELNLHHLPQHTPTTKAKHVHETPGTVLPKKVARTYEPPKPIQKTATLARGIGMVKKVVPAIASSNRATGQKKSRANEPPVVRPRDRGLKPVLERVRDRAQYGQLRPAPGPTRTIPNLLSSGSSHMSYPVLEPDGDNPGPNVSVLTQISLSGHDSAETVNGMAGLALSVPDNGQHAGPRRSSRIAARGAGVKGLR